jgi:flagellar biosynthetic protein FliQ
MTGPEVLDVARDAILTMLKMSAPALVVTLVVGVAVSLVQALTQIQEQTLVFVPKIVALFLVLVLALPFMGDALAAHMARVAQLIVSGG